jgi:hypothetical protein
VLNAFSARPDNSSRQSISGPSDDAPETAHLAAHFRLGRRQTIGLNRPTGIRIGTTIAYYFRTEPGAVRFPIAGSPGLALQLKWSD